MVKIQRITLKVVNQSNEEIGKIYGEFDQQGQYMGSGYTVAQPESEVYPDDWTSQRMANTLNQFVCEIRAQREVTKQLVLDTLQSCKSHVDQMIQGMGNQMRTVLNQNDMVFSPKPTRDLSPLEAAW